jgi:hypothetical protein
VRDLARGSAIWGSIYGWIARLGAPTTVCDDVYARQLLDKIPIFCVLVDTVQLKPIPLLWHPNFSFSLLPQIQQQGTSSCQVCRLNLGQAP